VTSDVLTATTINIIDFLGATPCTLDRNVSGEYSDSIFTVDPENRGSTFFQNTGMYLPTTWHSIAKFMQG
jgi:hypothetical protein